MIAQCQHANRAKHGKDRNGRQRWKCRDCGSILTSSHQRPLGDMRVEMDKAAFVLSLLLEGMSIRAAERITGMKRQTICDLILVVGENCDAWLGSFIRNVACQAVELDEIWDFLSMKAKTKEFKKITGEDAGDSWSWFAICADSKMILSHITGQRDEATCLPFLRRLNIATAGRIQVSSDGLSIYTHNVPYELGSRVDFAQIIKSYAGSQNETRYSPATITGIEIIPRFGNPDLSRASTSYAERFNLSVRMHVRRFTRLTNAHSKSARHHAAMTSLFVAWYNFCRKHESCCNGKGTPAMAAGITTSRWTLTELLWAAVKE